MVRNPERLRRFEDEWVRRQPPALRRNLAIVEALAREAARLGVFRRQDPLEGVETVIRVARAVNRV